MWKIYLGRKNSSIAAAIYNHTHLKQKRDYFRLPASVRVHLINDAYECEKVFEQVYNLLKSTISKIIRKEFLQ